jgi:hypothetical protein
VGFLLRDSLSSRRLLFQHNSAISLVPAPRMLTFLSMRSRCFSVALVLLVGSIARADRISFDSSGNVVINGTKKIFPIGFTLPPPPTAKTPTGGAAWKELHDAGALFVRSGVNTAWDTNGIALEKQYQDTAALYGLYCQCWLRNLATATDATSQAQLKTVINTFKGNKGLGIWKGADEPWWGNIPVASCQASYNIIKANDPDHPVWIVQAPRGTSSNLAPYNVALDVTGIDIYPISYPPGVHSTGTNKAISMVGDFTDQIISAAGGKKPVWMTLQIAFSGTTPPNKRLRFPDYTQERFMAYQAIIHGARGLQFFGGSLATTLNPSDAALGWNWTFWNTVMKRLLGEVGSKSPLEPALLAPKSTRAITVTSGQGIEFTVREITSSTAGSDFYIIAAKREATSTVQVTFSGIPSGYSKADVMFESPATVTASNGAFTDWFGPFDVHVYHFHK